VSILLCGCSDDSELEASRTENDRFQSIETINIHTDIYCVCDIVVDQHTGVEYLKASGKASFMTALLEANGAPLVYSETEPVNEISSTVSEEKEVVEGYPYTDEDRFVIVDVDYMDVTRCYYIVDRKTTVTYYLSTSPNGWSTFMTPVYKTDGTPELYLEEL
jgi:hypothetical protein